VGAVIQATIAARAGEIPKFSNSMPVALRLWGWMFWTRFLTNLATVLGLIALIIPGVYLAVRLCSALQVVMVERHFGTEAMRRSFALTRGRFWKIFLPAIVIYFIFIAAVAFLTLPLLLIPAFEHWIIQGFVGFIMHLCYAFVPIAFTEIYLQLKSSERIPAVAAAAEATVS
jgi:hypothetical protein